MQKLAVLDALMENKEMPFSKNQLKEIKEAYIKEGCMLMRYSEANRQLYHPAYRMLLRAGGILWGKAHQSKSFSD